MKKKLVALMMSVLMLLSFSATAMAATTMNANEQAVIKVLRDGFNVNGAHINVNAEYIQMAEQAMFANDVDMTSEQSNRIIAIIRQAFALVQKDGGKSVQELATATKSKILGLIKEAAAVVGYTVEYNASTKDIVFRDTKGNVIFDQSAAGVIKNTGASYQTTVAAMGALAVAMVGAGVVAKKKKLFA